MKRVTVQLLERMGRELARMGRRFAGFPGKYHHSNAVSIDAKIVRAGFERERLQKLLTP